MIVLIRAVVLTVFAALLVPGAAFASAPALQPGVHVDPGSPAGKEYQIPITAARGQAAGGSSVGSANPPLFGVGVTPSAGAGDSSPASASAGNSTASGSTGGSPASGGAASGSASASSANGSSASSSGARSRSSARQAGSSTAQAAGAPVQSSSDPTATSTGAPGGNGWIALVGGGLLVLVLGGGGGLALRQRALRS